jgi:type I restriction enzyme, S subunit
MVSAARVLGNADLKAAASETTGQFQASEIGPIPVGWDTTRMGAVLDFQNGVNADAKSYGKGIPFANVLEVLTHPHLTENHIPGCVQLPPSKIRSYLVRKGDVLFNRTSETQEEVGLSSIYVGEADIVFGGFVIRGQFKTDEFDSNYCGYAWRHAFVRQQIIARGQGAVRANIGQGDLRTVVVPKPPLPEQKRIAEVLSDADALIESLEALAAKKRAIKQGAMQELLSGKRRLPGFSKEWKTERLGNVMRFQVGFPFSSVFFSEEERGIRLVKNRDLKNEDQVYYYSGPYEQAYVVDDGDVLVGMDGEFVPCRWRGGTSLLNQRVGRIVPFNSLDKTFSYYYLQNPLKEIEASTSGTTVKHLSHGDVEGIERPLPCKEEQKAIGTVLLDMDTELEELAARLAKAHEIKQGMMQDLLTGRVRLV